MAEFKHVTDEFSTSPQIDVADVARAKAQGVGLIIDNRPDGEDPAAPQSADIEAAAKAAGIAFVHIPVVGGATPEQVAAMRAAIDAADGKVLAYCRSGTRSINTWALGQDEKGRDALVELGAAAGYDLSNVLPR
jgi:uncharacterized protein (TIGR01244 family)